MLGRAARLLAERADGIAAEMVAEEGKPLADARNEATRTPKNLDLYAGEAYRLTGATLPERRHAARLLSARSRSASSP